MRVHKPRNLSLLFLSTFTAGIFLFGSPLRAEAATYTVTNTNDNNAGSLRQAILDANANPGADEIDFAVPGCPCTITLTSGSLFVNPSSGDLTINGPGASMLTVDGNGASIVFNVPAPGNATMSGLTVTGGNGGGIAKGDGGSLSLNEMVIDGNNGGGIVLYSGGFLSLVGSTVSNNTRAGNGGGILIGGSGSVSITNSTLSGNSGTNGGGAWVHQFATMSIVNSKVTGNTASGVGAAGGGIYSERVLTITDSTVSGNGAPKGGGIYIGFGVDPSGGHLTVERSTISGNQAFSGGGIYAEIGTSVLTNTTVSRNTAASAGGGIFYNGVATAIRTSTSTVKNSTIFDNYGMFSGSVMNVGTEVHLDSTIVANGSSPGGCNDFSGDVTANHSLIRDINCVTITGGSNLTGIDPLLGPLQGNGGPTKTHALLLGSPAIDAGSNPLGLTTDQRGANFDRVVGTAADIGAFEMQPACEAISFGSANNLPVVGLPTSVTTGDFNGDGTTDLATANVGAAKISVLIGNGDGTFAPAVNFAVGSNPISVTTGDFNGDDKTDLAVANAVSDNVSVLTGNGDGTFAPAVNFAVGDVPTWVTTGDFNGDGKTDLATVNAGGSPDNISVLIGSGDGTFAAAVNFPVGNNSFSVTTGDFNGDGKTDLAATNGLSDNISVLIGNGDGTFAAGVTFPVGDGPLSVTTGDFNSDTKTDLAIANQLSDNISVLIGYGDGSFALPVNFAAGDETGSITTGDFNGDGKTDLAAANRASDNVSVLIGNGDGTFAVAVNFPVGDGAFGVTTGDFNGDGKTDFASANRLSNSVSVLLNSCSANTAPVASADAFSTNEDTPLSGSSVLSNDTDGENDTLTAVIVSGPTNAQSFTLNSDGSFSYTPNENFNGSDSFTYKANDGSLDSNVATVTITVNAVNDGPVVSATPATQSVQYSDPISAVAITGTDIDSTGLTASTAFNVGGGAFSDGLPNGLSFGLVVCSGTVGSQCRWGLSGKANVAAGTYVIRVTVSDGVLSSSTDITLVVNKEKTETVYTGDVFMFTAGPTVTTANVRLSAQLTQQSDGNAGDITKAKVSFLLFKSTNLGATPDLTVSSVPVDGAGAALKFINLGVDTWTIKVKIDADNGYWKASPIGMGTITVEQPTNELRTSGGGWIADAQSMNGKGDFGFNVANQKKGVRGGSVYLFRGLDGFNYLVKATSWQSGGIGFGSEGGILSKAAFSGKCVVQKIDPETGEVVESYGNYSFTVDVRDGDLFNPKQADKYAITMLNSNGLVWRQIGSRTNPPAIGGGNITVKAK